MSHTCCGYDIETIDVKKGENVWKREHEQDTVKYPKFQKSKGLVWRQHVKFQRGHCHIHCVHKLGEIAMPPAPVVQFFVQLGFAEAFGNK